jgi:predicted nucleic-acid-binding protein
MIGLDTNVLLRWLAADEGQEGYSSAQADAVERAVTGAKKGCFVNPVVLAETIWVVANVFKQPKALQAEIVHRLLHSQNVGVGERVAVEDALLEFETKPSGGFADLLIAALNQAWGCETTITFDKRAARSKKFQLIT